MDFILEGNKDQLTAKKIDEIIKSIFEKPYRLLDQPKNWVAQKFHLSLYPVSKNLRMYSTVAAKNLANGKQTSISLFPRKGEFSFSKKNLNWSSWYPWIYTNNSFENTINNRKAWSAYFQIPKKHDWDKLINTQTPLKKNEKYDLSLYQMGLKVLALNMIFRFSPRFANEIHKTIPKNIVRNKFIGVHIRRGDVISVDNKTSRYNWPIIPVVEFAEKAKKVANKHNTSELFLSTDSRETVDQFIELTSGFNVHINSFDRSKFFRVSKDYVEDVETYIRKNAELGFFYALSALSDLYMLAQASELICTINSEFSRTAWYLALSQQKQFVPFTSLYTQLDLKKQDSIFLI